MIKYGDLCTHARVLNITVTENHVNAFSLALKAVVSNI